MSDVFPRPMAESVAKALSCRQCQAGLAGTEHFCPGCGAPLPTRANTPTAVPAEVSPAPVIPVGDPRSCTSPPVPARNASTNLVAASAADTFACTHCSQALPREAVFCFSCGQKLPPPPPAFHLYYGDLEQQGESRVRVEKELVIGKAPECGLVLESDQYVSRQHARVSVVDGKLLAEDLGSSNGTFLRLRRPIALQHGDELVIGTRVVRIVIL